MLRLEDLEVLIKFHAGSFELQGSKSLLIYSHLHCENYSLHLHSAESEQRYALYQCLEHHLHMEHL